MLKLHLTYPNLVFLDKIRKVDTSYSNGAQNVGQSQRNDASFLKKSIFFLNDGINYCAVTDEGENSNRDKNSEKNFSCGGRNKTQIFNGHTRI